MPISLEKKSCLDCPSFLGPDEAEVYFGRATGKPMCATYGYILNMGTDDESSYEAFADGCESHMVFRPKTPPERLFTEVFPPNPALLAAPDHSPVRSCMMCSNYIRSEEMFEKFGITAGGCAVLGKVVLDTYASREAKGCDYSKPSSGDFASTDGLALLPVYNSGTMPVLATALAGGVIPEPCEHVSDREVTDEEREQGIISWRKVVDQKNNKRFTFLPIFDVNHFDDFERSKVPSTGDVEHPEWYVDGDNLVYTLAVAWVELDETPVLWGMPGIGKTELLRHVAWLMQVPFDRISITESSEVEDVIGKMMFVGGETRFQRGRVPLRWEKPGVLLLDEPNTGPDALWQRIRPLTDNSKQMVLDEAGGEAIERNLHCYFSMAMNPAWDAKNVGAKVLGTADNDRLTHVYMDLPRPEVEKEIIRRRVEDDGVEIEESTLDAVMRVAAEIRRISDEGTVAISWGIRPNIKAARMLKWFDPITAYKRAITDHLDPQEAEIILSAVRAQMGK